MSRKLIVRDIFQKDASVRKQYLELCLKGAAGGKINYYVL